MVSASRNDEPDLKDLGLPEIPDSPDQKDIGKDIEIEEVVPEHSVVIKANEPGKFVASKTGTTYHAPKCDWAKRIKKSNMIWFSDEKQARRKGYKKHDCLKK